MQPLVIFVLALLLGASVVMLLRCLQQNREQTLLRQQLTLETGRLREGEKRHRMLFVANPYPMWIYDYETLRFTAVNEAAVRTYGFSREEFLGMTLLDIRPPEEAASLLNVVSGRRNGLCSPGIWRHRRKNGSLLFAEVKAFAFEDNGRKRELVLAHDVTQRHLLEEALQQSRAYLQSLVDSAPLGICRSSVEGDCFETLNTTLREMLGYNLEEALQLKVLETGLGRSQRACACRSKFCGGTCGSGVSRPPSCAATEARMPVRISGSLVRDNDGAEHFEGYVEDMTQQNALEQQVRQVQKLEAVGRLAGGMAHDFNNVLVVIKLSTELMLRQITPDNPLSKPLLQVSKAADRAAALTRQMLAFGRQQIMQTRIINLNFVVSETSHMLRQVIGEDIQLITKLSDAVDNSRLDPDQVAQVILNLAVNARDAMPEGGTLHLETANVELDDAYARAHPPVNPGRLCDAGGQRHRHRNR